MINCISKINKKDIKDKRVVLRLDLNVPIKDGKIVSDFRIKKSLKTLNFLKDSGVKVVIISHIKNKEGSSLYPVSVYLKKEFNLAFIEDIHDVESIGRAFEDFNFVLIENIRNWEGEEKNDLEFSKYLSSLGDIYINDAFSVSHREHSSVVGVPKYLRSFIGFQMEEEINSLDKVLEPKHPFSFILGGAKFETKIPLIKKYGKQSDLLYVGGALANDVYKTLGYSVGESLVGDLDISAYIKNLDVITPLHVVVKGDKVRKTNVDSVKDNEIIVDADPESLLEIRDRILKSKMIVWNGPLGLCEEGFTEGTKELAKIIAESDGYSIVGGGDTIAAISELGLLDSFSFISTGGGAMLEYLSKGSLLGIDSLKRKSFLQKFKIRFFKV